MLSVRKCWGFQFFTPIFSWNFIDVIKTSSQYPLTQCFITIFSEDLTTSSIRWCNKIFFTKSSRHLVMSHEVKTRLQRFRDVEATSVLVGRCYSLIAWVIPIANVINAINWAINDNQTGSKRAMLKTFLEIKYIS